MNADTNTLTVHITYKNIGQTFSGKPEDVWTSLDRFFRQLLPTFELAEKLILHVDLQALVSQCNELIAFSVDGSSLLVPRAKLTDNEALSLVLLAAHIGFRLGKTQEETVSKYVLQAKLGKDMKTTSTRLGEMTKGGMVTKTGEDVFKITTFGLLQMQKEILPRIKAKFVAET